MPEEEIRREPFVERRKGNSWISKSVSIISGVGWALTVLVMMFVFHAQPVGENIFTHLKGAAVITQWNVGLLRVCLVLLILVCACCLMGLVINRMTSRRKTDRWNRSIIILSACAVVFLVAFLLLFGSYLL